jgi:hypothetical protein
VRLDRFGAQVELLGDLAVGLPVHDPAGDLELVIEYDPQPPFDSGSPETASASTLRLALKVLRVERPFRTAAALSAHALLARLRRARYARRPRAQGPIYGCLPDALTGDRQEA